MNFRSLILILAMSMVSILELGGCATKTPLYDHTETLFFISDAEWVDKGDYYEIAETCEVRTYNDWEPQKYGKIKNGSFVTSCVIRIRKDAEIHTVWNDLHDTAENYANNEKDDNENEQSDAGLGVVYYPKFDKDEYVIELVVGEYTPSLGY